MIKKIFVVAAALILSSSLALATSNDHSKMDHGKMNHGAGGTHKMEQTQTKVMGEGVIHSVSKLNRMVNLTHAPIPELKWPEMQMDLPVSDDVDLNKVQPGDKVKFHLVFDEDKKYRIYHIEK